MFLASQRFVLAKTGVFSSVRHHASAIRNFSKSTLSIIDAYSYQEETTMSWNDIEDFEMLAEKAKVAQAEWKKVPLQKRCEVGKAFLEYFVINKKEIGHEISVQMGKPVRFGIGEVSGLLERGEAFIKNAPEALKDRVVEDSAKFLKVVGHEPVGTVLSLAPWNYPLLTAINSVMPALLCGNAVLLSHGPKTPLTSFQFYLAMQYALEKAYPEFDMGQGLVQDFRLPLEELLSVLETKSGKSFDFVTFTGSSSLGQKVYAAVAKNSFIDCTLELGAADGAYVAAEQTEKTLANAVETVVDAAMFNSGQSCCSIERVFVHEKIYDEFLAKAIETAKSYKIGVLFEDSTMIGPMAQFEHVVELEDFVEDAVAKGGNVVLGGKAAPNRFGNNVFFLPTIIENCNHDMKIMQTEVFGPLLAVTKVSSDDEAIEGINSVDYGLTSAVFTSNEEIMPKFFERVEAGTIFMNRADYLDPELPWQGRKSTGKGASLGLEGFRSFTRLKNKHYKRL